MNLSISIAPNFILPELVPPQVWEKRGERSIELLDDRILIFLQKVRNYYRKPVIVNTWYFDQDTKNLYKEIKKDDRIFERIITGYNNVFFYRGLRPFEYKEGATYSQHKYGRAVDFHISGMDSEEIRKDVLAGRIKGITTMETDISWFHGDVRFTGMEKIRTFKP